MNKQEIETALSTIREWLWEFPRHDERGKALFAFDVAFCALESCGEREKDPFFKLVIDLLC